MLYLTQIRWENLKEIKLFNTLKFWTVWTLAPFICILKSEKTPWYSLDKFGNSDHSGDTTTKMRQAASAGHTIVNNTATPVHIQSVYKENISFKLRIQIYFKFLWEFRSKFFWFSDFSCMFLNHNNFFEFEFKIVLIC